MAAESVDLQVDETATLVIVAPTPWVAPTAEVRDRYGDLVGEPTATPSTINTTVDGEGQDASTFIVASLTGIARGRTIQVTDSQWGTADRVIESVSGYQVKLVSPLPGVPGDGATVVGLDVDVEITADMTADTGKAFVLEVKKNGVARRRVFNVCKYPFIGPANEQLVAQHMSDHFPSERRSAEWCAQVAAQENRIIRARLLESAAYVSEFWGPDALEAVELEVRDVVLWRRGYPPPRVQNVDDFMRSADIRIENRIGALLKGAAARDPDLSGDIDDDEIEGGGLSQLVR